MAYRRLPLPCAARPARRRRLRGDETVVIVVVLVLAGALAVHGMPSAEVLSLLLGAGLVAVGVVTLWALRPLRILHAVLRALPAVLSIVI